MKIQHKEDGQIVSSLELHFIDLPSRKLALIEEVLTLPEFRRRGYATKVMSEAIELAKKESCDCVELTVNAENPEAIKLYERLGFYNRNNVAMRLPLNDKWAFRKKGAKVIAVSFKYNRQVRLHCNYPDHCQDISDLSKAMTQVKTIVDFEVEQEPGMDVDTIIVNSNSYCAEGDKWLDSINGTKTKGGKIIVMHREGFGWSFGSYARAFKELQNEYDYFLFTEDDILVGGESYYKKLVDKFEEDGLGFLGLVGVHNHHLGVHCGGGVGLSSTKILKELERYNGGYLPHHTEKDDPEQEFMKNRHQHIVDGEVALTNTIHKMGYKLGTYNNPAEWNLEKNLCVPYYNYKT